MPGNRQVFSTAMNAADRFRWDSQWTEAAKEYQRALAEFPEDAIQFVSIPDRAAVRAMAQMSSFIDVIIPRGGRALIEAVAEAAEEAAFNAMVAADTVEGRDGNTYYGFPLDRGLAHVARR